MQTHRSSSFQRLAFYLQCFWHWATPFWLFRDASCGSREQRCANYRHNCAQRDILPFYTLKWMAIAAGMMLLLQIHSDLLSGAIAGTPAYFCAALFCISSGIGFSFACIVIAVLMTCYLFFTHVKE